MNTEASPGSSYTDWRTLRPNTVLATFQRDNKKRYYVVNLSSVYKNEIKLQLPVGKYICITEREKTSGVAFALELGAGEGAYIIEE